MPRYSSRLRLRLYDGNSPLSMGKFSWTWEQLQLLRYGMPLSGVALRHATIAFTALGITDPRQLVNVTPRQIDDVEGCGECAWICAQYLIADIYGWHRAQQWQYQTDRIKPEHYRPAPHRVIIRPR
jgi:hypothetical protein